MFILFFAFGGNNGGTACKSSLAVNLSPTLLAPQDSRAVCLVSSKVDTGVLYQLLWPETNIVRFDLGLDERGGLKLNLYPQEYTPNKAGQPSLPSLPPGMATASKFCRPASFASHFFCFLTCCCVLHSMR